MIYDLINILILLFIIDSTIDMWICLYISYGFRWVKFNISFFLFIFLLPFWIDSLHIKIKNV